MSNTLYSFNNISMITWVLIGALILVIAVMLLLLILPSFGVNVRDRLKKILQKTNDEIEVTSDYVIHATNESNPPTIITESGVEELISHFAIKADNSVVLYSNDENGNSNPVDELPNRYMLEMDDPLIALKMLPGIKWKIRNKGTDIKMRQQLEAYETRIKILESELKAYNENNITNNIINEGNKMKQVRIAAYGHSQNPFNRPDKFGFGSRYRRPFSTDTESDDGGEE